VVTVAWAQGSGRVHGAILGIWIMLINVVGDTFNQLDCSPALGVLSRVLGDKAEGRGAMRCLYRKAS
jgi:hypothetical protein